MGIQTLNRDKLKALMPISNKDYKDYALAVDSIHQHIIYCQYHHNQSVPLFKNLKLVDENGFDNKTKLEAHALAHLQSLHALVDSIPYIVLLLNADEIDKTESLMKIENKQKITPQNVSLKPRTIKRFSDAKLDVKILEQAITSTICKELRDYINQLKHRYIAEFTVANDNLHISVPSNHKLQPLEKYIVDAHNHIIYSIVLPFYNGLYKP